MEESTSHIKPIGIVHMCTDVYRLTGADTYVLICKIEVIYGWVVNSDFLIICIYFQIKKKFVSITFIPENKCGFSVYLRKKIFC